MEGAITFISRLDAGVVTVVHCLGEKENRGGHRQKLYADTNERMINTAKKPIIVNAR